MGKSVRGTPIHHVGTSGTSHEGMKHGAKPAGMKGTVHEQYDSDRRGYESDKRSGTPYHSQDGNGAETRRVESHGKYGRVIDKAAGDQADPSANGSGVVLDGAERYENGHMPHAHPTMDSPVPRHAPVFDAGFIAREDAAHAGRGNEGTARENIMEIGGVMSRGMDTVSQAGNRDETELTHDDTLNRSIGKKDI